MTRTIPLEGRMRLLYQVEHAVAELETALAAAWVWGAGGEADDYDIEALAELARLPAHTVQTLIARGLAK